jgi:hypothetical protein
MITRPCMGVASIPLPKSKSRAPMQAGSRQGPSPARGKSSCAQQRNVAPHSQRVLGGATAERNFSNAPRDLLRAQGTDPSFSFPGIAALSSFPSFGSLARASIPASAVFALQEHRPPVRQSSLGPSGGYSSCRVPARVIGGREGGMPCNEDHLRASVSNGG